VLGIDEHTGLVLDLEERTASVVGNATVTVRWPDGAERVFEAGTTCSIEELASRSGSQPVARDHRVPVATAVVAPSAESPLNDLVRQAEAGFSSALERRDLDAAVQVVLDLEAELHRWANETFSSDEMDRARATLRSMVVRLGQLGRTGARDPRDVVAPFVDALLDVRSTARSDRRYSDADAVRDRLVDIGIEVRDTPEGTEWDLREGLVP